MNAICNSCDEEIYEIVGDIISGQVMSAKQFISLSPDDYPNPADGDRALCPLCQHDFCIGTGLGGFKLKTTEGVKP